MARIAKSMDGNNAAAYVYMKQKRPQTHEGSMDNMEQQYGGTEE